MILTGKAKEAFLKHENQPEVWLKIMYMSKSNTVINALIIEWLDSVGIYVDIEFFRKDIKDEAKFVAGTTDSKNGFRTLGKEFNSRQQATERAIERAVEMFNSK